jgi:teichuronic acid exporter
MSITKKIIKGSIWNSIGQFGVQGINIVITIVFARLIEPEIFGLFGMVAVLTTFFGYFSEFGFIAGLIQKKEIDEIDCNTVFWGSIMLSWGIYIVIFFCAPLVAIFYNNGSLILITRIVFLFFLINPINFIPTVLEVKKLQYHKIAISDFIGVTTAGLISIILAFFKAGIWALVAFSIVQIVVKGITLTLFTGWVPKFVFSFKSFKWYVSNGIHFTINNLILYFSQNVDYLLVGKLLGAAPLGYYTMAFRISKYPLSKAAAVFGNMFFPVFASFTGDREKIKRNLFKISFVTSIFLVPVLFFAIFGIKPLILLVIGEKWRPIIPIVVYFFVYLIVECFCIADDSVMLATGRVKTLNAVKSVSSVLLLGLGFIAIKLFGIIGMVWVFSLVTFGYLLVIKIILLKSIRSSFAEFFAYLGPVLIMFMPFIVILGSYWIILSSLLTIPILYLSGELILTFIIMAMFIRKFILLDFRNKIIDVKDNAMLYPGC